MELDATRREAFAAGIRQLAAPGCLAVSVPFLSDAEIDDLKAQALALPMRKARPLVGKPGREVVQDFEICFPAPRQGAIERLAELLEEAVNSIAAETGWVEQPFRLNDAAVQHYPKQSVGIGIHRDALRYRGLVFIITLDGDSRLCQCDDRDGSGAREIDDRPGRIAILSAAGFAGRDGEDARPLHFVDRIEGGRLSIGLRYDSKADEGLNTA